jgi:hypothetical protein
MGGHRNRVSTLFLFIYFYGKEFIMSADFIARIIGMIARYWGL